MEPLAYMEERFISPGAVSPSCCSLTCCATLERIVLCDGIGGEAQVYAYNGTGVMVLLYTLTRPPECGGGRFVFGCTGQRPCFQPKQPVSLLLLPDEGNNRDLRPMLHVFDVSSNVRPVHVRTIYMAHHHDVIARVCATPTHIALQQVGSMVVLDADTFAPLYTYRLPAWQIATTMCGRYFAVFNKEGSFVVRPSDGATLACTAPVFGSNTACVRVVACARGWLNGGLVVVPTYVQFDGLRQDVWASTNWYDVEYAGQWGYVALAGNRDDKRVVVCTPLTPGAVEVCTDPPAHRERPDPMTVAIVRRHPQLDADIWVQGTAGAYVVCSRARLSAVYTAVYGMFRHFSVNYVIGLLASDDAVTLTCHNVTRRIVDATGEPLTGIWSDFMYCVPVVSQGSNVRNLVLVHRTEALAVVLDLYATAAPDWSAFVVADVCAVRARVWSPDCGDADVAAPCYKAVRCAVATGKGDDMPVVIANV